MIKNFNKFIIVILLFFTFYLIINPNILITSVNYSINIFIKYVFPTLFPFFILSDLLINYNATYYFGKFFKNIFGLLFNIGEEESFIYVLSIFSGQPSNAKYIKDLLDRKIININNATILLSYSFFPSPMFIIGTVGLLFYNNIIVGFLILSSIYLANFIFGFCMRKKYNKNVNNFKINKNYNFGKIINDSIFSSFNTLLIILGSITIFTIIINILSTIFYNNDMITAFTSSLLEITIGCKNISDLNTSMNLKILLTTLILSFGGFSVHTQIKSILYNYNIKYFTILKFKIYIALIASLICFLFLQLMDNNMLQ